MNIIKTLMASVVGMGALATSMATVAASWEPVPRLGLGVGRVTIEMDDVDLKGSATAWEIFGGIEFNRYFALEAGYMDGGKAKDNALGAVVEADTSAFTVSAIGTIPVNDVFGIYGRAGAMRWKSDQSVRVDGRTLWKDDFDGTDAYFGAGLAVALDGALLRVEYRVADLDDSDLSLINAGVVWRFR